MKLCVLMLPLVVSALRINATCSGTVREATGTSGVDNATRPRLADTAERDYFILRETVDDNAEAAGRGTGIYPHSVPELTEPA